jgi:hypothetical protein
LIEADGRIALNADVDHNAMRSQRGNAAAAHLWKGILHGGHDTADTRRDDSLRAWAGSSCVATRFERAVQRRPACAFARFVERVNFRVRFAGAFVGTVTHDDSFIGDNAGADNGIRRGTAESPARLLERAAHPPGIRLRAFSAWAGQVRHPHHFSWNNAST